MAPCMHSSASRSVDIVQVRTRAVSGLPEQYRGITLEINSNNETLKSSPFTRQPEGIISCEFWARLPYPSDGVIKFKVSPTAPWLTPQFRYRGPARSRHGLMDLRTDAPDAAEAHQGRCLPGSGGTWRSMMVTLGHHHLVDRLRDGKAHPHADAKLQVEYCLLSLPPSLSRLPELDLLEPLARPLHCYAHGGFMGAALSLLADPQWATLLLAIAGEEDEKMQSHINAIASLQRSDVLTAQSQMLPLMLVLENSPVLCAFGLVRSGCTKPPSMASRMARATGTLVAPAPYVWQGFGLPHSKLPRLVHHLLPRHDQIQRLMASQVENSRQVPQQQPLQLQPLQEQPLAQQQPGTPPPVPPGGQLQPVFNRYGYAPLGLEWDLWLSPDQPADLVSAVVDHGSAGDLVQQAIAMALRCDAVAKHMGRRHNKSQGISPMRWLVDFATALNHGVNGKEHVPLPLWAAPPSQQALAPPPSQDQAAAAATVTAAAAVPACPVETLVPYNDGSTCPNLEQYLRLRLESLVLRAPPPHSREALSLSSALCRVRLVGNTHTHEVVWLDKFIEMEEPPPPTLLFAQEWQERSPQPQQQPQQQLQQQPQEQDQKQSLRGPPSPQPRPLSAKVHVCVELRDSTSTSVPAAPPPPPGVEPRDTLWYPVEAADLGRSLLVVEVYTSHAAMYPSARAVTPLSALAGSPSGALTFTAPLHHRRSQVAAGQQPAPATVGPGPLAEGQLPRDIHDNGDGTDSDVQGHHNSRQLGHQSCEVGPPSEVFKRSLRANRILQRQRQQRWWRQWRNGAAAAELDAPAPELQRMERGGLDPWDHPTGSSDGDPWVHTAICSRSSIAVLGIDGSRGGNGSRIRDTEATAAAPRGAAGADAGRAGTGSDGGGACGVSSLGGGGPLAEGLEAAASQHTSVASSAGTSRVTAMFQQLSLSTRSRSVGRNAPHFSSVRSRGRAGETRVGAGARVRSPSQRLGVMGMGHALARMGSAGRVGRDVLGVAELEMRQVFSQSETSGSEDGDNGGGPGRADVHGASVEDEDEDEEEEEEYEGADEAVMVGWAGSGKGCVEGAAGEGGEVAAVDALEQAAAATSFRISDVLISSDPEQALSYRHRLAAAGRGALSLTLRWDTLTVLQAAQQLYGLPQHVAQSCTAMLSSPGGLFLDIKSGYSRAKHLRSFASTLAGIGIHVKAICSFVPKQIDFGDHNHGEDLEKEAATQPTATVNANAKANAGIAEAAGGSTLGRGVGTARLPPAEAAAPEAADPTADPVGGAGAHPHHGSYLKWVSGKLPGPAPRTFDSVLFFHGLNGLELACEAGRVPPGTCVLFNGASMLLEDPGSAVVPEPLDDASQAGKPAGKGNSSYNPMYSKVGRETGTAAVEGAPEMLPTAAGPVAEGKEDEVEGATPPAAASVEGAAQLSSPTAAAIIPGTESVTEREEGAGGGAAGSRGTAAAAAAAAASPNSQGPPSAVAVTTVEVPIPGGGGAQGDLPVLVDKEAWRRYCTVVSMFKVFGGIYVQEPDCCPAALDALVHLTNRNPGYLPLGFAYGHLGDKAVAVAGYMGRGMAAQQLLEELACRRALSNKVRKWINQGVHVGASDQVYLSWGRRVLTSTELLYLDGQQLLLRLLADYDSGAPGEALAEGAGLLGLLNGLGGFRFVFLRFFKHYEAESPLTFLELGFNTNYTKALLRLLRNRAVFAAMTTEDKARTAVWLVRGSELKLWVEWCCLRGGRHKLVKEALACLVESCSRGEFQQICEALGGSRVLLRAIMGWTWLFGWSYRRRLQAAERFWTNGSPDTSLIASGTCTYGFIRYARRLPGGDVAPGQGLEVDPEDGEAVHGGGCSGSAAGAQGKRRRRRGRVPRVWLGPDGVMVTMDPRHTRDKAWALKLWRLARKWSCCLGTWTWNCFVCSCCGCCYTLFLCPVLCYPYCRSRVVPFIMAVVLVVFWILLVAGAIGVGQSVAKLSSSGGSGAVVNATNVGSQLNGTMAVSPPYYPPLPI